MGGLKKIGKSFKKGMKSIGKATKQVFFSKRAPKQAWTPLKSMNNSNVMMISIVDGGSSDEIHVIDLSC